MEKTVRKAFAILEHLAAKPGAHRVTDIAEVLGLTKPNAHRLLATLVDLGYASRDESSRYQVTLKIWEMGSGLITDAGLQQVAHPVLRKLSADTGQSAALAIFNAGFVVFVACVEAPSAIRPVVKLGSRIPATTAALGKAMLPWLQPGALEVSLQQLRPFTSRTELDPRVVGRELELVRERGYATSRSEHEPGVCGLASPIFDANGRAIAAIGLRGAEEPILGASCATLAAQVVKAAREISSRFGYVEQPGPGIGADGPAADVEPTSSAAAPASVRH